MKGYFIYLYALCLITISCTKDCYEGDVITEEEAIKIIQENELNDSTFAAQIIGQLNCVNNKPLEGLQLDVIDSKGYTFRLASDGFGNFNLPYIQSGRYVLTFTNGTLPAYTVDEYDIIISNVEDIVFGSRIASNVEKLAYNILNYDNGITTVDLLQFNKLKEGDLQLSDIDFPWRYVLTDSLDVATEISDSIVLDLEIAQKLELHVTPIYFGDPLGQFCN